MLRAVLAMALALGVFLPGGGGAWVGVWEAREEAFGPRLQSQLHQPAACLQTAVSSVIERSLARGYFFASVGRYRQGLSRCGGTTVEGMLASGKGRLGFNWPYNVSVGFGLG
jgi:hypothetical protein